MPSNVPLASSSCKGTTVLYSPFCRLTWLPLWRTTSKPARWSNLTSSGPERTGSLGTDGYLEGVEHHLASALGHVVGAEGLKVEFDRFLKVCLCLLDGGALGDYA